MKASEWLQGLRNIDFNDLNRLPTSASRNASLYRQVCSIFDFFVDSSQSWYDSFIDCSADFADL